MKLKIKKTFLFAHRGCVVVEYAKGQEIDTDDKDLIETVIAEKWAEEVKEKKPVENKALQPAPENKSDQQAPADLADQAADAGDTPAPDAPAAE